MLQSVVANSSHPLTTYNSALNSNGQSFPSTHPCITGNELYLRHPETRTQCTPEWRRGDLNPCLGVPTYCVYACVPFALASVLLGATFRLPSTSLLYSTGTVCLRQSDGHPLVLLVPHTFTIGFGGQQYLETCSFLFGFAWYRL